MGVVDPHLASCSRSFVRIRVVPAAAHHTAQRRGSGVSALVRDPSTESTIRHDAEAGGGDAGGGDAAGQARCRNAQSMIGDEGAAKELEVCRHDWGLSCRHTDKNTEPPCRLALGALSLYTLEGVTHLVRPSRWLPAQARRKAKGRDERRGRLVSYLSPVRRADRHGESRKGQAAQPSLCGARCLACRRLIARDSPFCHRSLAYSSSEPKELRRTA